MARLQLNDRSVRALEAPAKGNRIDYDVPKGPRDTDFVRGFAVRTTAAGTRTFLLVYVTNKGRERRHKLGDFGAWTVSAARDAARQLRTRVDAGGDPFAEVEASRAQAEADRVRQGATFGAMLEAYIAKLRRLGKASADKVEGEIERTIKYDESKDKNKGKKADRPVSKLWKMPVDAVTVDDLAGALSRLVRAGKLRQAEKTRSYIRAAYTAATAARGSATGADLFADFHHVENIARDLGTVERPKTDDGTGDKRALSVDELRAYWKRIRDMPSPHGALLRFHLLTGGQRAEQLARLEWSKVDADARTIELKDTKGRRTKPRRHVVPVLPDAWAALEAMRGDGPFAFTLDGGTHGAVYHTLREQVQKVAAAMMEAGEVEATFTPGELRITVETRLAGAGVSLEVRAHLQSHGLGGVQARHYDKHDYLDEKREALEKLRGLLNPPGKVVPIRRSAK